MERLLSTRRCKMKIINIDYHKLYATTDKITTDVCRIAKQSLENIAHIQVRS
jgi:hypothetical protein